MSSPTVSTNTDGSTWTSTWTDSANRPHVVTSDDDGTTASQRLHAALVAQSVAFWESVP